jgi:hypothetical protein
MTFDRLSLSTIGGIRGIEELDGERLCEELENGARFVTFTWCVSLVLVTFRRPTGVIYLAPGRSGLVTGLPYLLLSLLLGWWGLPWGPVYTVGCVWTALRGGADCTSQIVEDVEIIFPEGFSTPEQRARMTKALEKR